MMTKRNIAPLLLLVVFAFTTACGGNPVRPTTEPTPSPLVTVPPSPAPMPPPPPTVDSVAETLAGLTTEQKVAQLLVAGIEGMTPGGDAVAAISELQVGGVILFGRNVKSAPQLAALTNNLKGMNGDNIPLFVSVDQEGGRVDRMPSEVSRTPSAYTVEDASAYGAVLAAECAAFGFNMDFAPSLDIWSNPENTVIGDRSFGQEWEGVGARAFDATDALRAPGNVVPVVKHFPGHGDTAMDSHVGLPVVDKTLAELMQSELMPFEMLISGDYLGAPRSAPVPAVMVAHILMSQIDPKYPASLSPAVVTDLLRGELGFSGVVVTDDLTMAAISDTYGMGEAAVLAVEAGCDLLLVCHKAENLTAAYTALLDAVRTGRISTARLDESVTRLLALKTEYALTNDPVPNPDVAALNETIEGLLPQG